MLKKSVVCILCMFLTTIGFSQNLPLLKITKHEADKKVDILIGKELFTSLLYADSLKKAVLYPINAPGNIAVTRGWPIAPKEGDQVDHPHQIGSWFSYGDVNGADYWNNSTKVDTNKKSYGTIRFDKIISIKNGKGKAELVTASTWFNPKGKAMLEEISSYTFRVDGKERIIDRKTSLKALRDVLFKDSKEGLFAIRVARELEHPSKDSLKIFTKDGVKKGLADERISGKYESTTGLMGEKVFGTRSSWLKLSGRIDNQPVGIAIIDHPKNINFPGYWMARGYGLFAINPLGAGIYSNGKEQLNFSLKEGENALFRHRLVIGNILENTRLDQLYKSFKSQ